MHPHYIPTPKDLYRFWSRVDLSQGNNGCWIWTGSKSQLGYGFVHWERSKIRYAHRISWEIAYRESPGELQICHKCDNPSCVNPQHMFLGTQKDNIQDKIAKGRQTYGEKAHGAKLTDAQVAEIRQKYIPRVVSQRKLAREYGVSQMHIKRIVTHSFRAP